MNKLECLIDKMESALVSLSDGRLEHKKIYVAEVEGNSIVVKENMEVSK